MSLSALFLVITCYLLHLVLQKDVEVLTPSTYKWDLLLGNQVKMKSLGEGPNQHDWCHYKKGKFGDRERHSQRGDDGVKTQRQCRLQVNEGMF